MSSERYVEVMICGLEDQGVNSSLEDFDCEENSDDEYDIVGVFIARKQINMVIVCVMKAVCNTVLIIWMGYRPPH